MDIGLAHGVWTFVLIVVFVAIVAWAYSGSRREEFDHAALIPLDDDFPNPAGREGRNG